MKKLSQSGFAIVELAILVVALAVLGGAGYLVWRQHDQKKQPVVSTDTTAPTSSKQTTLVPSAPQVNNASDLNGAMQALNQTDLAANSTDSSQLSTQTNGF